MVFEFTEEHNELLKGVSRVRSLEILLDIGNVQLTEEQKQPLLIQKNTEYLEYVNKMIKIRDINIGIHYKKHILMAMYDQIVHSSCNFIKTADNILKINNIGKELENIATITGNLKLLVELRKIPTITLKFCISNQSLYL